MAEKTVYSYYADTKEYAGETIAWESPLEPGEFLIPACATEIAPPELGGNVAAVFNEESGAWEVFTDHRGEVYYDTATKEQHTITKIGEEPDSSWTDIAPTDDESVWDGQEWVVPFEILKARKANEIAAARYTAANGMIAINGHTYDISTNSRTAFLEMMAAIGRGDTSCLDWKTGEGFVHLCADEFVTMVNIVLAYRKACFEAERVALEQLEAVTTEDTLDTIAWVEPDLAAIIDEETKVYVQPGWPEIAETDTGA